MFKARNGNECYLIAIEGPDKLGKATQAARLETALPTLGMKAITEEIPYKDGITRDLIYKMLFDGRAVKHPVLFQTIQATNRRVFQSQFLPNLAQHFDAIILDRWSASTWVYGRATGVSDEQTAAMLDGILDPDLVFVLDGVGFPAAERKHEDDYEKDAEFQARVRKEFQRWAAEHSYAHLINANQAPNMITTQLIDLCRRHLRDNG